MDEINLVPHVGHKVKIMETALSDGDHQYTLECDTCGEYVAEQIVNIAD